MHEVRYNKSFGLVGVAKLQLQLTCGLLVALFVLFLEAIPEALLALARGRAQFEVHLVVVVLTRQILQSFVEQPIRLE